MLRKSTGIAYLFISSVNIKIALEFIVQVKDRCGGDGDQRAPTDSEGEGSRDVKLLVFFKSKIIFLSFIIHIIDRI